jgi:AcrR family transcriptional regulator
MSDETATRSYRMQRRAQAQEETRLRITESAVALHGTLGPSKTSMGAVAEHAGVRRSTVYRHFPDEAALFDACSAHWVAANPRPDPAAWAAEKDPDKRLRVALAELYAYYRRTEPMLSNLFRDEPIHPVVKARFGLFHGYMAQAQATLLNGRRVRGAARRRTNAALGHAVAFPTWKSLTRDQGLSDAEAVAMMRALVSAAG